MGSKAPIFSVPFGDHPLQLQALNADPNRLETVDQLILKDANGKWHNIRLFSKMRAEQFQRQVSRINSMPPLEARIDADPVHWGAYLDLLRSMWPNAKFQEYERPKFGDEDNAKCNVQISVNEHYFRVIAKIAFHGYLVRNQRGIRGDEPGFAAIREFIMTGEMNDVDEICFGASAISFAEPFGPTNSGKVKGPKHYSHFLASDETELDVVGYVHLFLGPGCQTNAYHVALGTHGSKVLGPGSFVRAHFYEYYEAQPETGVAGTVREAVVDLHGQRRIITGELSS